MLLLPPLPDDSLEPFRGGVAVLRRGGAVAGHVATSVSTFWAPLSLSGRRQWSVRLILVWANGDRERPEEDYPPWTVVREMQAGTLVRGDGEHCGEYTVDWMPEPQRVQVLAELGMTTKSF